MRLARLTALVIAPTLALAACSGAASTAPSAPASVAASVPASTQASTQPSAAESSAAASAPAAGGNAVTIANFAFAPSTLTVKVGTEVTWTNNDSTAHTVTADDKSFDSSPISPGSTFKQTFATAGSFAYHCSIHPTMTATITVTS